MNEYLISGIIGAVIGYFINIFFDLLKSKVKNLKTLKIRDSLKLLNFKNDNGYMPIDHAVPQYDENNICLKNTNETFIVPIPKEYREELQEFGFEYHDEILYKEQELLSIFNKLGIQDYKNIIQDSANVVASNFLTELRNGLVRFNGYLFGIDSIRLNRYGEKENAALSIDFYKTDYFTYRVFANIYQQYKECFNLQNIVDVNSISHFLSSFGLGCYVIASDGEQEYMIVAHRGLNVLVDKDKLHFSMNEAFSMLDVDMYGNPSFVSCLYRGLKEELGINEAYNSNIIKYGFMDLSIDLDRLECGISCYIRLRFNNNFTVEQFNELYKTSQDKELETTELEFVPMKMLRTYIKENKEKFSVGCLNGLYSLLTRYESNEI